MSAVKTEGSPEKNEKKRSREDDGADETPAKKVDTKSEVAVEAS
jgi:lupus La protein